MPTYEIKHSTELMENYQQATVMAPQKEFRALQTPAGRALVFSIASDDLGAAFTVTAEVPADRHGWEVADLSASAHTPVLPCQHFAVGQRPGGSVHLAIALRSGPADAPTDAVYLADLALDDAGRVQAPAWTAVPYDGPDARARVEVAGIFLSQATDGEYVIVDLVRDPDSPTKHVVRYYLDRAMRDGRAWHLHDIPIDLSADVYASVLGRRDGDGIDGVYVGGQINGSPQILYTPLFNELQPSRHPYSSYLSLTDDQSQLPDALAVCPNPADGTTDLYAAGGGALYRFPSTGQSNGDTAALALAHPLFQRTQDLFAFDDADRVVIWGRNADNLAFYTWCPRDSLDTPGSWSLPLPILTQVQHVSPFVNRDNRANTIVAHTGDSKLRVGLKSPGTGAWAWREVTLPPADVTVPARKINSYTTRIQVFDEHKQPAAATTVSLTATNVTTVYINHLYYVVGPTAVHVPTDATGTVTVVEAVPRITGTQFQIAVADDTGTGLAVNPMDKTMKKSTSLQTVGQLRDAQVVTYANGTKQPPRKLVRDGVDDTTLQQVADLNKQCAAAYANPKQGPPHPHVAALAASPMHSFVVPADAPVVDAGDLFQYLEAGSVQRRVRAAHTVADAALLGGTPRTAQAAQESWWDIIVRWFEGAWEFVVKIGEAIYRCILEVVEDIIAAVRWIFDKIVAAVEDLIHFLQFLFEWDDFRRTKDVIKNVTTVFFRHEIDQITVLEQKFDGAIDSLIATIDTWAGLPKLDGLGADGAKRPSSHASTDGPDAPGAMMSHHLQGNVGSASHSGEPPKPPDNILALLEKVLDQEKDALGEAFDQLKQLVEDAAGLSLVDILKRLAAILADAVLRSVRTVVDALLDLVHLVAETLLDFLDAPIHIPVISDILNAIGIPDFSMLDAICWVAAVPVTIGYKIGTAIAGDGRAPFPDNAETKLLIEAEDFAVIQAAFAGAPKPHRVTPGPAPAALARPEALAGGLSITMSPVAQEAVFISLHSVAGVCAWVSAFLDAYESILPSQVVPKLLSIGSGVSAFVGGVSRGVGNALVPRLPVTEDLAITIGRITLLTFVLNKVAAAAAAKFQQAGDLADYRARGGWLDAFLILPAAGISILHFVDLGKEPEGKERSVAIIDESASIVSYVARFLYTLVVSGLIEDEEVKIGLAAAMGITEIVYGGMQFAVAAVEGVG